MLKISGESLAGTNEQGFDFNILNDLAESIKKISSKNIQISFSLSFVVLSKSNIALSVDFCTSS